MPTGMFPSSLWATGRSLRPQTSVASWILHFGGVFCLRWLRPVYVPFIPGSILANEILTH